MEVQETDVTESNSLSFRLVCGVLGLTLKVSVIYRQPGTDPDLLVPDLKKSLLATSGDHIILHEISLVKIKIFCNSAIQLL